MNCYRIGVAGFGLLLALPAAAADLPQPAPPPYIAPLPVFTWTGFYAGVNLGGGWGGRTSFTPVNFPGVGTFSTSERSGFVGGGHFGYNWQFGAFVAGIETDIDGVAVDSPHRTLATRLGTFTTNEDSGGYVGSVRGRIGYAWDRLLVFGTGGFAYGGVSRPSVTFQPAGGGASIVYNNGSDRTATGFAVGGGLEYAVTDNWIIRGEYLYYDLGHENFTLRNNTRFAPAGTVVGTNVSTSFNVARIGAEYKF